MPPPKLAEKRHSELNPSGFGAKRVTPALNAMSYFLKIEYRPFDFRGKI